MLLGLWACGRPERVVDLREDGAEPDVVLYDFEYEAVRLDGTRSWTLHAEEAVKRDADRVFLFKDVRLLLYEGGAAGPSLTARRGMVRYESRDMTAWSNVRVVFADGTVLTTEELHWSEGRQVLHTTNFVRIVRPSGEVVEGYGLEMDRNAETVTILRQVRGTWHGGVR